MGSLEECFFPRLFPSISARAFVSKDNSQITALISCSKVADVDGGVPGGIKEGPALGEEQRDSGELEVAGFLEGSSLTVEGCTDTFSIGTELG